MATLIERPTSRSIDRPSFLWSLQLVRSGQRIFCEGDAGGDVFQLFSGTVRLSSISRDGRRLVAGFVLAEELFSLSHDNRYLFTAEAVSDCSVGRIRQTAFCGLPSSVLGERIAAHLLSEPWLLHSETLKLLHKYADEAIAYFLNNFGSRQNPTLRDGSFVRLQISRCDIADYLGLTVETVCRGITRLVKEGILGAKGPSNDLQIRDVRALRSRAGV